MTHQTRRALLVTTFALTAAMATATATGCGGDGSAFEGVYSASAWTDNDASCDAEGASVLADQNQTTFYIKLENFFGSTFLNVKFCDAVADCTALAAEDDTIHIGRYSFENGGDSGWSGGYYSGVAGQDGICSGDWVESAVTGDPDTGIRLEIKRTPAGGFAPDSDGFCDDGDGMRAAQGQPCTRLEVITASRVQDL